MSEFSIQEYIEEKGGYEKNFTKISESDISDVITVSLTILSNIILTSEEQWKKVIFWILICLDH